MYRSDEYIAIGITGLTPGFYARNVLYNTPNCTSRNTVNVEMIDMVPAEDSHIPLNMEYSPFDENSLPSIASQRDLSIECH
jgi:hypothetical protein